MDTLHFPSSRFDQYFKDTSKNGVYEPAEDTFLLLDAIEKDIDAIRSESPTIVVEVGCGSGAVIGSLIRAINNSLTYYIATDVNPSALEATKVAMRVNGISDERLALVHADILTCSHGRLDDSVDLLVFNPPYVVTDDHEIPNIHSYGSGSGSGSQTTNLLPSSWAGGLNGMRITSRFLSRIPSLLTKRGRFYLVLVRENHLLRVIHSLKTAGVHSWITMERKCGNEHLFVLTGRMAG